MSITSFIKPMPHPQKIMPLFLIIFCLVFVAGPAVFIGEALAGSNTEEFPEFPHIRNNVDFWEKIYATYSLNTAVIHDQDDLTKIYEVVNLIDHELPDARRINNNHLNSIKEKYSQILLRLSSGHPPETRDESRVANMFHGPSAYKAMRFAADNIRAQNGQRERFLEGVARSSMYLGKIRQIFREYGLPADLAYLPHVESSFNYQAYSKCGAAGIWQFTRSTGKQYMRIDHRVDERRDPLISTRAAAKLLKKNYEALGSWPLAITAYNYGTAGMVRAAQSHGSYENIFRNYNEGYFKFASRNFYSEFLAARKLAKELGGGYSRKTDVFNRSHYSTTQDSVNFGQLRTTSKDGQANRFATPSLSRSTAQIKKTESPPRLRIYTVKNGDTVYSIATTNNISTERLCRLNNISPKVILRAGQNLRIPVQGLEEKATLQPATSGKKRSASVTNNSPTFVRENIS
jgi:membrane-bound lytic murein transglycosylase D